MKSWKSISTAELRKLDRNASPRERGDALKRASAIYRGEPVRSNPSIGGMGGLVKLGAIGAAAYLGYKMLGKKQTATTATVPAVGVNTSSRLPF